MSVAPFPVLRHRRLRASGALRELVADVRVVASQLVCPLFVGETEEPVPVESMPGVEQLPVGVAVGRMRELAAAGVGGFLLFGVTPEGEKDAAGMHAASPDAAVNRTLNEAKEAGIDAVLIADLCFCEYTDHGHCGPIAGSRGGTVNVDNDATLEQLSIAAAAQAAAGADVVAPSGMMDGQVAAVRRGLDAGGFQDTPILSYSVKYASNMYGPFRDAGGGGMAFGDRRGYQMDPRRRREWRTELAQDMAEGADMVMVKPAMSCLDIIKGVRESCDVPVAAYHVSGEYAMIHAAAQRGWLDLEAVAVESTRAIVRAGADVVVTYFAEALCEWLS